MCLLWGTLHPSDFCWLSGSAIQPIPTTYVHTCSAQSVSRSRVGTKKFRIFVAKLLCVLFIACESIGKKWIFGKICVKKENTVDFWKVQKKLEFKWKNILHSLLEHSHRIWKIAIFVREYVFSFSRKCGIPLIARFRIFMKMETGHFCSALAERGRRPDFPASRIGDFYTRISNKQQIVKSLFKMLHCKCQASCHATFAWVYIREYWMIYRGPSFLAVVWFGSSPTPFPLSRLQGVCLSERGEGGWAWSQILRPQEYLVLYKSFNTLLCTL